MEREERLGDGPLGRPERLVGVAEDHDGDAVRDPTQRHHAGGCSEPGVTPHGGRGRARTLEHVVDHGERAGQPGGGQPVEKRREPHRRGPGHDDLEAHGGRADYRSAAAARSRAHAARRLVDREADDRRGQELDAGDRERRTVASGQLEQEPAEPGAQAAPPWWTTKMVPKTEPTERRP